MKLRTLIATGVLILTSLTASAAQVIVPAAGTGPGANGSTWKSDLLLHNVAPRPVSLNLSFHLGTEVLGPVAVTIPSRNTIATTDFVKTTFGVASGSGALVIDLDDRNLKYLAVTSRTYNVLGDTEFGQDIPAVRIEDAAPAGSIAVISNPAAPASRFNFGLYNVTAASVKWELVRANGTVAATKSVSYAAGEHAQYAGPNFFGVEAAAGDSVYARVESGKIIVYGSSINPTGDPTFVPSTVTREDILFSFGVDLDENGTVDVHDADGDGVLDQAIDVYTSLFPAHFRVVIESEFGTPVTLSIVESDGSATFRDDNGTLRVGAAGDLKNTAGEIVLRATSDGSEALFTIPVRFK